MAGKKENIKALFTNTRSRVIIVFTAILLIVAVVFGIAQFIRLSSNDTAVSSDVPNTPGMQSIPGGLNPTAQYAKLQEAQNVSQAEAALQTGGSAIPTIIRSQTLGAGVESVGSQTGQGGIGFSAILREDEAGQQRSNWILELQNNTCNKETVSKVTAEGASLTDLKEACSCIQLKDIGYQLADLEKVCSCKELKATGVTARQLKDIGYTAGRLRACGFDACELRNAGFTAQQMKDGGFSDGELKGAGFSDDEIARASGLPDGITEADVLKAGCQPAALAKLKAAGVTASAIRRISGCSARQLAAAGYTAQELRDAGFTAADLKNAGFTAAQLRQAGFSARDLLNAGFTPADLLNVGYTPDEIAAAESELPPGITPADIKKAGCDEVSLKNERLAGVSAKLIRQYAGCSAAALKAAGFTDADLANAGFTPQQIAAAAAGVSKPAGDQTVPDSAIKAAGCDPAKLTSLFRQGVSAKRIHDLNGCSAAQLKAAGYDAKALLAAGFSPVELLAAGFTPEQLNQAGINPAAIIAAGRTSDCSVASLTAARAAGVTATAIRQTLGCSAAAMKAAGYTAAELKAAGFTAAELKAAGFSAQELKAAGFTAKELRDAGFTAAELKNAGFTASQLKEAGFTASELKAAGFGAKELKDAGFSAKDLKDAGFSATDLKNAGFSAKELKEAGFNAKDLKDAGFSAQDLKDAGFSAEQLRLAGYTAKDLLMAGYTAKQLSDAGYSAAELADAGIRSSQVAGLTGPEMTGVSSTMPTIPGYQGNAQLSAAEANSAKQLQEIMDRQTQQLADQKYQQQIQQRTSEMLSTANQALQDWKKVDGQSYVEGTPPPPANKGNAQATVNIDNQNNVSINQINPGPGMGNQKVLIKTGDILFAVIDTSVNSDEPSPILATIVSGKFKGAKLIGSFNLPGNADKMVITFNTMSVPGADKSTSINAYAIDADTARTALSSNTNHHYLQRYGALFASSFLMGFGNAIQSANTTVTVGGAAGTGSVTVQNGIGRSTLENAVIGLATLGQNWAQIAQQTFNRPTTVQVYSGTGVGILFTQDVTSL